MDFNSYQDLAGLTVKPMNQVDNLAHASLGLASETGEFTSVTKRMWAYEKPMTPDMRENMLEELGDILWYAALAATALGASLDTIASDNIAKLKKRYPNLYSNEAAEARADKGSALPRITPVTSSNLATAAWANRKLFLQFNNGLCYSYDDVPELIYDNLISAPSVGKFFHAEIRDKYVTTPLPVASLAEVIG